MVDINDIHVGDRVVIAESHKRHLPGPIDEREESLEVLLISYDRVRVILKTSYYGWPIEDLAPEEEPGNEGAIDILRSIPNHFGWYIGIERIERVIPGSEHAKPVKPGVFDPLTSKVKTSKEEREQFKKDMDFFFRDLTEPYHPPEGAWAKWS